MGFRRVESVSVLFATLSLASGMGPCMQQVRCLWKEDAWIPDYPV
jgi:hypothetical protein